jgi:multidrug transporter EmrE-like cation transporter
LSTPAVVTEALPPHQASHKRGVILVFICTLVSAAAQILMKMGADYSVAHTGIEGMMTNLPLLAGYALYGVATVLMVLAFKDGELGVLYPIISLSYVWVTLLSPAFFHDTITGFKVAGVLTIICGVAVLGRSARK